MFTLFVGLGIVFVVYVVLFVSNCCPLDRVLLVGLVPVDAMRCKFVAVGMVFVFWLGATWFARGLCWFLATVAVVFSIAIISGAVARVYLGGVRSLLAVALVTLVGLPCIGAAIGAVFCFLLPGAIGLTYQEKQATCKLNRIVHI